MQAGTALFLLPVNPLSLWHCCSGGAAHPRCPSPRRRLQQPRTPLAAGEVTNGSSAEESCSLPSSCTVPLVKTTCSDSKYPPISGFACIALCHNSPRKRRQESRVWQTRRESSPCPRPKWSYLQQDSRWFCLHAEGFKVVQMSIKARSLTPLNTGAVSQNMTTSKASMNYFRSINGTQFSCKSVWAL